MICDSCIHSVICGKVAFLDVQSAVRGSDGGCPHYQSDTRCMDDIKRIAVHYGRQAQTVKCVEELNELAVALLHNDYPNIVEEIADVEITIAQVKILLDVPEKAVEEIKQAKIERTLERIGRQEG